MLTNDKALKIIAVRNNDPFPVVLVYWDENHPNGISGPNLLSKIFPQENFQLSQPVNTAPNQYHLDGPEIYAGMQVKFLYRKLDQGGVSFILISPYEDLTRVTNDFQNIAKGYNPPTRLPFEKQLFDPHLLWWGTFLFGANLLFLWIMLGRFETFSKIEDWD
ncbi:MAG: hypothetical protein H6510_09785 [Acidobacteria bacterium]|nr:hypothetical protein [Acidobacteriota bacterium]